MDDEKITVQNEAADAENAENTENVDMDAAQPAEEGTEKKHLLEMHESPESPEDKKKKSWKKELLDWIKALAAALIAVVLIRSLLFTIIRVDGPSMSDTLLNNDRLFVSVLDMRLSGPDRFDVVILHYPNRGHENFVKRVIGVPGDTIEVHSGVLSINGTVYEEPYLTDSRTLKFDRTGNDFTITLGEDEYFVMGDNRDNSNDSRAIGVISGDMFVGKVRAIIWPSSRWGLVE